VLCWNALIFPDSASVSLELEYTGDDPKLGESDVETILAPIIGRVRDIGCAPIRSLYVRHMLSGFTMEAWTVVKPAENLPFEETLPDLRISLVGIICTSDGLTGVFRALSESSNPGIPSLAIEGCREPHSDMDHSAGCHLEPYFWDIASLESNAEDLMICGADQTDHQLCLSMCPSHMNPHLISRDFDPDFEAVLFPMLRTLTLHRVPSKFRKERDTYQVIPYLQEALIHRKKGGCALEALRIRESSHLSRGDLDAIRPLVLDLDLDSTI